METVELINRILAIGFFVCYIYQIYYFLVPCFYKKTNEINTKLHKFAVVISARNEEAVISNLIESIKNQTYPEEYIDIFVIADNCTDKTAEVSKRAGAEVFVRFDEVKKGKGYALDFAFTKFLSDKEKYNYDAFFVFDADNVLEKNYIEEVNKVFTPENKIITGYRNSKNYGDNWITAGYSLWFIRESQFLNRPRMMLNTSCAISGTGFMFSREIIEKTGGWKYFLLTEDIEFTVDKVLSGDKIAYCENAMLYDEQPVKLGQSVSQRLRWAKGYIQIIKKYGLKLLKNMFSFKSFACYDMTMTVMPAIVFTIVSALINIIALAEGAVTGNENTQIIIHGLIVAFLGSYTILFAMGLTTVICEWKKIICSAFKKILYLFTFPIFMLTYIPISILAIFKRVEWKQIYHSKAKTLEEVHTGLK